jgi:very-short-patch-repair endonuclease
MRRPTNPKLIEVAKLVCRSLRHRQTAAERLLWEELRNRRFHGLKFLRQHPFFIEVDGRETFFVGDFYCHECRLVVELDGEIHRDRREEDRTRDEILGSEGTRVIRIANEMVVERMPDALALLERVVNSPPRPPSLEAREGGGGCLKDDSCDDRECR